MNIKKILVTILCAAFVLSGCNKSQEPMPEDSSQSISSSSSESSKPESSSSESAQPEPNESSLSDPNESLSDPTESSQPVEESSEASSEAPVASEASVSETQAEPQSTAGIWAPVKISDTYDLYFLDGSQLAYGFIDSRLFTAEDVPLHPIVIALNKISDLKETEAKAASEIRATLLLIRESYEKNQITVYDNAIRIDDKTYTADEQLCKELISLKNEAAAQSGEYSFHAQWLVWMNPNRVTAIECIDENGKTFTVPQDIVSHVATEPAHMTVSQGESYSPETIDTIKGFKTVLTFDSGIKYTIVISGEDLYVHSSDMNFLCKYKASRSVDSFIEAMKMAKDGNINIMTAKPVIYLYPDKIQDVSVKVNFNGIIDYTYPEYNGGWNVTASPDGTIFNKADGTTHYYLFWDGAANFRNWDLSEGFVITGSEVESFFKDVLPKLGLIDKEYNDFITYWTPILSKNPYNLISFSTAEYEAVAPLEISPAPDYVLRVHMIYKALDEPVSVKEQELPVPSDRTGFTVVEWGGTVAD